MKNNSYKIVLAGLFLCVFLFIYKTSINAATIFPAPKDFSYTTMFTTPVYLTPDLNTVAVFNLDIGTSLNVVGVLDTGFYQINVFNKLYYVPGAYIDSKCLAPNNYKELAKEILSLVAKAYCMTLDSEKDYIKTFAIRDINSDGIPELITGNGKEIYTCYDQRPVMIYYSETPVKFLYNKKNNIFAAEISWYGKTLYETLGLNYTYLPWGQLEAKMPSLSGYSLETFSEITYIYNNDEETKLNLADTLYSLYLAGNL